MPIEASIGSFKTTILALINNVVGDLFAKALPHANYGKAATFYEELV